MVQINPHVKRWYDSFQEGKIMGVKCNRCGAYEFPPITVCNSCSSTDLSWVEMSGDGKLVTYSIVRFPDPPFQAFAPYVYGNVVLEEGPSYSAMILGVDPEKAAELYDRLPIDVKAEIQDRGEFKIVAFRVKD